MLPKGVILLLILFWTLFRGVAVSHPRFRYRCVVVEVVVVYLIHKIVYILWTTSVPYFYFFWLK